MVLLTCQPLGFSSGTTQVRLWKVKRSQSDIIRSMRLASGLENHADLVAYWWAVLLTFGTPPDSAACCA